MYGIDSFDALHTIGRTYGQFLRVDRIFVQSVQSMDRPNDRGIPVLFLSWTSLELTWFTRNDRLPQLEATLFLFLLFLFEVLGIDPPALEVGHARLFGFSVFVDQVVRL